MGGRGGINILGEKKWHVWRMDNRLRVERDERHAKQREDRATRDTRSQILEDKRDELKRRRRRERGGESSDDDQQEAHQHEQATSSSAQQPPASFSEDTRNPFEKLEKDALKDAKRRRKNGSPEAPRRDGKHTLQTNRGRSGSDDEHQSRRERFDMNSGRPIRGGGVVSNSKTGGKTEYVNLFQAEEDEMHEHKKAHVSKLAAQAKGVILSKRGTLQKGDVESFLRDARKLADIKKEPVPWYMSNKGGPMSNNTPLVPKANSTSSSSVIGSRPAATSSGTPGTFLSKSASPRASSLSFKDTVKPDRNATTYSKKKKSTKKRSAADSSSSSSVSSSSSDSDSSSKKKKKKKPKKAGKEELKAFAKSEKAKRKSKKEKKKLKKEFKRSLQSLDNKKTKSLEELATEQHGRNFLERRKASDLLNRERAKTLPPRGFG